MGQVILKKTKDNCNKNFSLRDFFEKRKNILILREVGGLGDILMIRMIFEDFKLLMPDCKIHFACPPAYFDAVKDHPFIDKILDSNALTQNNYKLLIEEYCISYNISTACGRYEMAVAPFLDKHRSDIWAEHCGITLTKHNMHIRLSEEEIAFGKKQIKSHPTVVLSPISAMESKNLDTKQANELISRLKGLGFNVVVLHNRPLPELNAEVLFKNNIRQWMGIINAADYVISVDTSTLHCAGGLGKPVVGIFSWADGKVYAKYYSSHELVQKHRDNGNWSCGPCFNWCNCPKDQTINSNRKPCIKDMTVDEIMQGFKKLTERFKL